MRGRGLIDIHILLADDHSLFRDGMGVWLRKLGDDVSIRTAGSVEEVLEAVERRGYDLILLDLDMPGMQGADSIRRIGAQIPGTPIVIVSAEENGMAMRTCLNAGAAGYVPKSTSGEVILSAIRQVLAGGSFIPVEAIQASPLPDFSRKKTELLSLLAEGLSNRTIAERLHLTEGTVRQYVSEILRDLDVDNRAQAGIKARAMLGLGKV